MKLLDKYIGVSFLRSFGFSLLGLVFILMIMDIIDKTRIETDVPKYHLYLYFLYTIPRIVAWMIPVALILSVSFLVAQLSLAREMVAIYSAGISFYRAIATILFSSALLSVFLFFFTNFVVTPANALAAEKMSLIMEDNSVIRDVVWQKNFRGQRGYYFVYYLDLEKKRIIGGFNYLEMNDEDHPVRMYQASSAEYNTEKDLWILFNVNELKLTKDLLVEYMSSHEKLDIHLPEDLDFFAHPAREPSELNVFELMSEIRLRQNLGRTSVPYRVEFHMNFSFPVMTFIMGLVGAIAGASGNLRSSGPLIRSLLISIISYFVYYLTYRLGLSLGNNNVLPPAAAAWGPTALFALAALILVYRFRK